MSVPRPLRIHPDHRPRVTLRACGCNPRRSLCQPAPQVPVAGSLSASTSRPERVHRPLLGGRSAHHNPNPDLVDRNDRKHTETVVGQVRQGQGRAHCCSRILTAISAGSLTRMTPRLTPCSKLRRARPPSPMSRVTKTRSSAMARANSASSLAPRSADSRGSNTSWSLSRNRAVSCLGTHSVNEEPHGTCLRRSRPGQNRGRP